MRYYLDTNILVFLVLNKREEISNDVRALLSDYGNSFLTSIACIEELVHLVQIGKFKMPKGTDTRREAAEAVRTISNQGIDIVPVTMKHIETLADLPMFDDHRDPNDRLIISQAISDRIPLISSDRKFSKYGHYGLEFVFNER